ncbi:hypothetical protein HanRHA438_Chr04g0186931 [Helianthus annuus]|nr:hypothetical protein HanRHA438_Chr04g0186931 [Helianthus annuus]
MTEGFRNGQVFYGEEHKILAIISGDRRIGALPYPLRVFLPIYHRLERDPAIDSGRSNNEISVEPQKYVHTLEHNVRTM